ncbi:MAG: pyruvate kinase [Actinobacteria bacterium]|nr:pyruvate kinase [Actinomycetota bacterium]
MFDFRQTKIVATLGPATDLPGQIEMLLSAGLDCVRINCSYGGAEDWQRRVEDLRATERHRQRPVPVIFDLQGLKMRLAPGTAEMSLVAGTQVRFYGAGSAPPAGEGHVLQVDRPGFAELVGDGCELVIGDGTPRLAALARDGEAVIASVTSPGTLGPGKGVTVTNVQAEGASFTEKDERDLLDAVRLGAEFVAISYVRSAADIEPVRRRLAEAGSRARVIAKIEQRQAYDNLDEIIAAADGVMVARGDLGVAVGHEQVPLMQKDIIRRATQAGKLVITATQMLESMISSPVPTRAEAADVANAVIDGTSAVMLSAETSTGAYPVEAVTKMGAIAGAAESEEIRGAHDEGREAADAAVMHAALYLSHATGARALIVPTTTGSAARAVAKYRPRKPIVAIADDAFVAAQLNAEWGVFAAAYEDQGVEDRTKSVLLQAKEIAELESGDQVVVTAGPLAGRPGATNVIALREVP